MNASLYTAKFSKIEWVKGLGEGIIWFLPLDIQLGYVPLNHWQLCLHPYCFSVWYWFANRYYI